VIPNWPERIHAVGIGGGGMSALAAMFADEGHEVSGSDRAAGPFPLLDGRGVVVSRGHDATHLDGHGRGPAEFVIRSAAVPDDNPELIAARALGLPILKYSEALGRLMLERPGVAVAGTHGKTTTTALLAHLLTECGRRPGWAVGGGPLTLPARRPGATGSSPSWWRPASTTIPSSTCTTTWASC
jgi:UDP-N-acetylmuramate--alanine ligase